MMTKDEAIKLALEALGNSKQAIAALQAIGMSAGGSAKDMKLGKVLIQDRAIMALQEVLVQPAQSEQKPVCWIAPHGTGWHLKFNSSVTGVLSDWEPRYTSPPKREPLTLINIATLSEKFPHIYASIPIVELCRFVADIEAAHGIKGTQS